MLPGAATGQRLRTGRIAGSEVKQIIGLVPVVIALLLVGRPDQACAQEIRLGAGDVVRITVYGQNDLETVARISSEGTITFPLVGQVTLAGLTPNEAEREVARELSEGNFVRNPQVSLLVQDRIEAEAELVTILGKVKQPGRFAVQAIEGGAETIVGLIALAGGMLDDAANYLILTRQAAGEEQTIRVDLDALLKSGDLSQNHELMGGDIVFVPRMDVFYIFGQVQRPGSYRLERGMTVMQAISVGSGLTQYGSEKGLTIKRRDGTGKIVDYPVGLDDLLRPDDVLYVKSSGIF